MTYGSHFSQYVKNIQSIDVDHSKDHYPNNGEEEKKNKYKYVHYLGRHWMKNQNIFPTQPDLFAKIKQDNSNKIRIYADQILLQEANKLLNKMKTLQEKVAQLCFLETDAVYDTHLQAEVESRILNDHIGGILFRKGSYKHQAYLIDYYQKISKTTLLVGNDFLHGLSFYFQGDRLPSSNFSEQCFSDLGKAVMSQNRRLGVHVQFNQERNFISFPMVKKQIEAFSRGIRQGKGIVAKGNRLKEKQLPSFQLCKEKFPIPIFQKNDSQSLDIIGFKTLKIFDTINSVKFFTVKQCLIAFNCHYDLFLVREKLPDLINLLCQLVRLEKIQEEELDRRITKILIIKLLFNNTHMF
ncbi:MAG: hypothetical protein R3E91_00835 [Chlamydiales bacterium]